MAKLFVFTELEKLKHIDRALKKEDLSENKATDAKLK
jgi:hypothetical protein